jgi:hypothetical protein
MSDLPIKPHPFVVLRINHKDTYDAVAMFVYLMLVYGWGLWIYPLGRDYHDLANLGADLPFLARQIFAVEVRLFGADPAGYHFVNIGLMYACMILVYHFVNKTVRGLWWFGSLAACLFMANPVHSEAMLNLSGVRDLVPCLAGLAALTAYAWNAAAPRPMKRAVVYGAAAFAAGAYAENAALGAVLLAYELLAVRREFRSLARGSSVSALAVLAALVAYNFRSIGTSIGTFDLAQMFAPLYLVFYPIGFLPKTVEAFHDRPWTAWLAAAAIMTAITLIHRKAKRPVLLFAVAGMLLLRVVPSRTPVDLTHMIGGGQLLLPNVLFVLGLIVVVFRIMDHPRWRVPMISITTTLVIILFAMQWRTIGAWHDAGEFVREFQKNAAKATEHGNTLGVLPDFQYFRGAPVCLSESIADDSPFSKSLPHAALLPLHPESLRAKHVWVTSWSESGGEVLVPSAADTSLFRHFPNAGLIRLDTATELKDVWGRSMPDGTFIVTLGTDDRLRVTITGEKLPTILVPGNIAGKEPDGEAKSDADH